MILRLLFIATSLFLVACGSSPEAPPSQDKKAFSHEPSDEELKQAVASFLQTKNAPAASGYKFYRIDLNNDKRRDALVFIHAPYGYWCGPYGCVMLVFKANTSNFQLVNAIQPVRPPVYVSKLDTNGWQNLIVRVSGRWDKAKNVALKFNGNTYPSDPSGEPPYSVSLTPNPSHIRVFNEFE